MKKLLIFCSLAACFLLLIPGVALGLNTAEVQERGGEITLMFIGDKGLQLGVEYGITPEVGAYVEMKNNVTRIGAKYELDSNFAILLGANNKAPFLGVNISMAVDEYISLMGDLNLSLTNSQLSALCELGAAFKIVDNLDLRGGLLAEVDPDGRNLNFQMGVGINY
jgi:hypothetical protein